MSSKPERPIALYFYRLNGASGGAERMICALANGLCSSGFKVHLVSWDEADASSFYPLDADVTWHRLGFRPGLRDKFRRARSLATLLRDRGVRVLAGFVMSGDRTVYAAVKMAGVRLVAAERNAPVMYRLRYGLIQRMVGFFMLGFADRIAVQFPEFIDGYPRRLRGRISVIPNPVAPALNRARPDRPGADGFYTVLGVGRFDSVQKSFDCLVRAFARIAGRHASWRLVLIGEGAEEAALRRLIGELGMGGRIRMEASTPDIFDAYAGAQLFAIPSRWEGFSNALAEAMSHGLPAVGFQDAAGVAQLIEDGASGWLAKGLDDDGALAHALDLAMTDGGERARRGARAAAAMAVYSPEEQLEKWVRLFNPYYEKAR